MARNSDALDVCNKLPQNEQATMLLSAQINYKLARYDTAADIYGQLLTMMPREDIPDLLTNLVACSAN